ncbi:hypothetical protein C8R45DRAFT_1220738 [Mycena sanguinolenta]|nr:hypothetical protein C8R45DRAFT_1220738 [Mycena sanguinolenta]
MLKIKKSLENLTPIGTQFKEGKSSLKTLADGLSKEKDQDVQKFHNLEAQKLEQQRKNLDNRYRKKRAGEHDPMLKKDIIKFKEQTKKALSAYSVGSLFIFSLSRTGRPGKTLIKNMPQQTIPPFRLRLHRRLSKSCDQIQRRAAESAEPPRFGRRRQNSLDSRSQPYSTQQDPRGPSQYSPYAQPMAATTYTPFHQPGHPGAPSGPYPQYASTSTNPTPNYYASQSTPAFQPQPAQNYGYNYNYMPPGTLPVAPRPPPQRRSTTADNHSNRNSSSSHASKGSRESKDSRERDFSQW